MGSPIELRTDYSSARLRQLARLSKDSNQSRRLLSLAAVLDGMSRADAAKIGGMDRQTLRDWVHRFNARGLDGLVDIHAGGRQPRLTPDQKAELAQIVETGPDPATHGVVRWRRVDIQRVIKERYGVDYHERYVGTLLADLGFSRLSGRPQHPKQDERVIEMFKNVWPAPGPQAISHFWLEAVCLNVSGPFVKPSAPGHDGYPRVPVLIKLSASKAIF
jgi:transposase